MQIWDQQYECMQREELEQLQLERLQATLNRAFKNVTCYRNKFTERGIVPEDIQSLDDLKKLPFTTKEDLRLNYPYGMFAVPLREVVRIHSSSGTTGKPTVVGYTKHDIKVWSNLVARFMTAAGVTHDDVVQIAFGYGLFTGAFGLHYGAEAIGASVIPMSAGNTEKQIMIMQDYKTTALVCTPSYAITIADRMEKMGVDPKSLSLKVGLFGAEPWSEAMRKEIENRLFVSATDNYGLSEIIGPGVAGDCEYKCGMHISEDAFIAEIIDPETGEVLPPGSVGELVLTTLTKEAFPMIRYRTRDITSLDYSPCACGRTNVRMKKTMGRSDDMLIVKGVNVFPSQIEEILFAIEGCEPHYQIVLERHGALDVLEVHIEVTENIFFDEMKKQKAFLEMVEKRIDSVLGVGATVKLVEPNSIPRHEGKAQRVIDNRKI
ncbi:phenylacetate--CoA ligase [Geobacter sulfurreducens]|jgi:phenylacetate-CoA ligase|uniref:Phenylacetate-coenzyme A ligase n=1 Tax=Geobacter sulfurreducens (strain ATCC 51573 / DSM 12127 / PCA) TaxID=243231 RepID=Q74CE5_GEOSL|nr:phenylacetate--CoA ligase [Geobacter sulfurreducens]AAR35106.1 phenylacetate--coenzyme A ligase [Geobacter sulfurreducens PCA]ADI84566.1 phenylacetate--coenzyme A ligase [Geobacter sulfurreducens KN400]AJY71263.1 phenylacetate--CoA ligase [Geobacter sulfurreducens]QVW33685.1 phenylacetate--CoA ligase [Geobacter sulfurreducens]UAC05724.1 phenylacetate--CoA ligase [Geobacter sulfurreducens]